MTKRKQPIWPKNGPQPMFGQGPNMLTISGEPELLYSKLDQDGLRQAYHVPNGVTARWASGTIDFLHPFNQGKRYHVIGVDPASPDGDKDGFALMEFDYFGLERRVLACYTSDEALERWNQMTGQDAPNSTTGGQDF